LSFWGDQLVSQELVGEMLAKELWEIAKGFLYEIEDKKGIQGLFVHK